MELKLASRQSILLGRDVDTCIVLLERNNQDLLQLKKQLNCYTCEPKTYSDYERYMGLKGRLNSAFALNLSIIGTLQHIKKVAQGQIEEVKTRIFEFNELKREVLAYRTDVSYS